MSNQTQALELVKARLNRLDSALDDYLQARIDAAQHYLEGQGISINMAKARDLMLVVDMAVWMYSSRDQAGGFPDWLRAQVTQRWLMERKGGADDP